MSDETFFQPWPMPKDCVGNAEELVRRKYSHDGVATLLWVNGWHWLQWKQTHYVILNDDELRQNQLYNIFKHARWEQSTKKGEVEPKPWLPDRAKLNNVIDPLKGIVPATVEHEHNVWVQDSTRDDVPDAPGVLIPLQNGVFELATETLWEHTPNVVNTWVLPFEYDPKASCPTFLAFLDDVLEDDLDGKQVLQQWLGYLISGQTNMQKAMLITGAPGAGKGVLMEVIRALIGEENTESVFFEKLGNQFALKPLEGKKLTYINDLRQGGRGDDGRTEVMLSLIADDPVSIEGKGKDAYSAKLGTRLMITTNIVPRLNDKGGALRRRFICMDFPKRQQHPDTELANKLKAELPGIFNWALKGLQDLIANGWKLTVTPADHERIISELVERANPVAEFVEERCDLTPHGFTPVSELLDDNKRWCNDNGYRPGNKRSLMSDINALRLDDVRVVKRTKRGNNPKQQDYVDGLQLKPRAAGWIVGSA